VIGMTPEVEAYLAAAGTARDLIADPAVARAWDRPSALAGFTVGGLAAHLGWMIVLVADALAGESPVLPAVSAEEHYRRAPWADAEADAEINVAIRDGGEQAAAVGHAAFLAKLDSALATVRADLPGADPDRLVATPVGAWALPLPQSLLTRLVEIAVHSDDLAVSVGLPTPVLPDAAIRPVLGLLVMLAAGRHGQPAVLRALTRSERAASPITAFGPRPLHRTDPDDGLGGDSAP
jgi:hypothetical protein